jgi:hypothetical protein
LKTILQNVIMSSIEQICDICKQKYELIDNEYIALNEWLYLYEEDRKCNVCKKLVCPYCAMTCYTCYDNELEEGYKKPITLCQKCNKTSKDKFTTCDGCYESSNCQKHCNVSTLLKCEQCKTYKNSYSKMQMF